jgi:hypothetical protein
VQEANCKRAGDRGIDHEQCLRAENILAVISAEPRAKAWADGMESFLRKWMENLGPDGFTFRNVQCRLSWCVVDAESTVGAGYGGRGHGIVLDTVEAGNNKIFQIENMFVRDPRDPTVWNVLVFFKRYCRSSSEVFDANDHLVPDLYTLGQKC